MLPDDYSEKLENNRIHPNSLANLTPPVMGEVRNPNGRPKGSRNRSTIVREALEAKMRGENGKEIEVVDAMTIAIVAKALMGDVPAYRELLDSGYGKVPDKNIEIPVASDDADLTDAVLATVPTEQLEAALNGRKPE